MNLNLYKATKELDEIARQEAIAIALAKELSEKGKYSKNELIAVQKAYGSALAIMTVKTEEALRLTRPIYTNYDLQEFKHENPDVSISSILNDLKYKP